MEAKDVAVWQLYIGDGIWRGSCPAEAGYCERMGRRTEIESGGSDGASPQHRIKPSIHYRPDRYTRRSCAERCVFTPGGLTCCHELRF
jgi:hypothetical protein